MTLKTYRVQCYIISSATVTVQAEDEFDALRKAKEADCFDEVAEIEEIKYDYAEEIEPTKEVWIV